MTRLSLVHQLQGSIITRVQSLIGQRRFAAVQLISVVDRCYVGDPVKGRIRTLLGNSVLHRKLLFDRVGFRRQISKRVRFAKRVICESRISLRDGQQCSSDHAITTLGCSWRMREFHHLIPIAPLDSILLRYSSR